MHGPRCLDPPPYAPPAGGTGIATVCILTIWRAPVRKSARAHACAGPGASRIWICVYRRFLRWSLVGISFPHGRFPLPSLFGNLAAAAPGHEVCRVSAAGSPLATTGSAGGGSLFTTSVTGSFAVVTMFVADSLSVVDCLTPSPTAWRWR